MYMPINWNIDMDEHGSESINMDSKLHKDAYSIITFKPYIFNHINAVFLSTNICINTYKCTAYVII